MDTTLDGGYGGSLTIDSGTAANLRKAGKWARFIGIVTMVFIGLAVVAVVGFGSTFLAMAMGPTLGTGGGGFITGILGFYVLMLAIFFYLTYLLYNFGAKAMEAVDQQDGVAMNSSFSSLSRLLKIYGVLMIIQLAFTVIWFVGVAFAGGLAAFGDSSY